MPGMFSSKRRSASVGQVHNRQASSSAAIAATSAFLKSSPSTTSLSSAAAAAALRSHTTSPEPIANIQTKRMVRRGSQSSNGSAAVFAGQNTAQGPGPLIRRGSSGSMTERTFRSPSPGGRVSPHRPKPAAPDAPPVPAVRPDLRVKTTHSPRPMSPVTNGNPSRGGKKSQMANSIPRPASAQARMSDSDRDVVSTRRNFSRPMSSNPGSPSLSPTRPSTAGSWFGAPIQTDAAPRHSTKIRPKSSSGVTPGVSSGIEAQLQGVARTPSKNYKKTNSAALQGALLAAGSLNPPPHGTAVAESSKAPRQTTQTKPARQSTNDVNGRRNDTNDQGSPSPANPRRPATLLHKQPSVVMEVPEPDEVAKLSSENRKSSNTNYTTATKSSPPAAEPRSKPQRASTPSNRKSSSTTSPRINSRPVSLEVPDAHAKSAHFSNEIIDTSPGGQHKPPGRSVSPAKSALKHSPSSSIRTNSPAATFNPSSPRLNGSDTSETMSMTSQDGKSGKKKKSARVSFDEGVVAPLVDTEAGKSSSANRSRSPGITDDDMNEMMKPRPALPSFGSVRTSPSRAPERGSEIAETSPQARTTSKSTIQGVSSDHAIGSILRNSQQPKSVPVTNGDEPLPPEVTTVEGNGQLSDTSDDEDPHVAVPLSAENANEVPATQSLWVKREAVVTPEPTENRAGIPAIEILPATPGIDDAHKLTEEHIGNAAESFETQGGDANQVVIPTVSAKSMEDSQVDPVPEAVKPMTGATETFGEALRTAQLDAQAEPAHVSADMDSDSDDSAAFSDAAEDPSELEPFGYASLDAIVESPVPARYRQAIPTASPSATSQIPESSPEVERAPEDGKDWSQTSAYWSHQKKQLQRRESDQVDESVPDEPEVSNPLGISQSQSSAAGMTRDIVSNPALEDLATNIPKTMRQQSPRTDVRQSTADQRPAQANSGMQRKTMRPMSASMAETRQVPLAQRKTPVATKGDDSDSESSFKRKRRSTSVADSGRYTMKRSMRSGSLDVPRVPRPQSPDGVPGSARWSVRSLSPVSPQANRGPTLRGENSRAKNKPAKNANRFSMTSFSKGAKPAASSSNRGSIAGGGIFKSRFADSDSDDDEAMPATSAPVRGGFPSRFVDSDDETQTQNNLAVATPVAQATQIDDDPFNDSSDDEDSKRRRSGRVGGRPSAKPMVPTQADIDRAMAVARQNVANMTGNQELLDPETPKGRVQKRGSMLVGTTAESQPAVSPPAQADGAPVAPAHFGICRDIDTEPGEQASAASTFTTNTVEPPRMKPLTEDKDEVDWPLTPPSKTTVAAPYSPRPATSDGVPASRRANIKQGRPGVPRSQSNSGPALLATEDGGEKTEKKKRFGRLRRAFGI
ncbi:hypothetical protein ANO11243_065400 [Dothideomycetidae sp. 11243]|nr:hypothetical protein ANO11243_065400 [fungal sp. No.11243]